MTEEGHALSVSMSALRLPKTLLDLILNTLILDQIFPAVPLASIFALSRSAKSYRSFILNNPRIFRYVDLSHCKGAYISPSLTRIDSGGHSWRAERMDENLTEDDFHSGPLRGVLSKLSKTVSLNSIHVLVLDGLASVTIDVVSDLLLDAAYDIWILSVIGCQNLNSRKLQQLLCYLCRSSRPEGSPKLKGLYYFGTSQPSRYKAPAATLPTNGIGVMSSEGAQLGSLPVSAQETPLYSTSPWYAPTGRVLTEGFAQRSSWEETLQVCEGIVALDAVLCTHMHKDMKHYLHHASAQYLAEHKPTTRPLASMALGPAGCNGCGCAPRGSPVFGESDPLKFPLLSPPPASGQLKDAVRPPHSEHQRLVVSCTWCLTNRHCESCHRWWCGDCYNPKRAGKSRILEAVMDQSGLSYLPTADELSMDDTTGSGAGKSVKVFNGLCVENCLVGEMMAGAGSGGMWG